MRRVFEVIIFALMLSISSLAGAAVDMSKSRGDVASFAGSFSEGIPIAIAPGKAGMQPALALNYSSSAANGLYGFGWNLDITRIEREAKNGAPAYTNADGFVLVMKGARQALVRINATEYRVANESAFLKISKNADNSWVITDQNHTQYFLGGTHQINQQARWPVTGAKTFSWHLSRVQDVHGNSIDYFYTESNAIGLGHRLSSIEYAPNNRVELSYEVRDDKIVSYRSGFRHEVAVRLSRVKSFAGQKVASDMQFSYSSLSNANDQRSLLSLATVHDVGGILPSRSTQYDYAAKKTSTPTGKWNNVYSTEYNYDSRYPSLRWKRTIYYFDSNGDGAAESLYSIVGKQTRISPNCRVKSDEVLYPTSFIPPNLGKNAPASCVKTDYRRYKLTPPTNYQRAIVDIHGDGYLDWLVKDASGNWLVYYNKGRGLSAASYETWSDPMGHVGYRAFYDVNGDGLPDLLGSNTPATPNKNWTVHLNQGTQFSTVGFNHTLTSSPLPNYTPVIKATYSIPKLHTNTLKDDTPHILQSIDWSSKPLLVKVTSKVTKMSKQVEYTLTAGIANAPAMNIWTVSKVTSSGPSVETRSSSYTYSGGLYAKGLREFRGFASVVQIDDQTNLRTSTTYAQDIIFQGRPKTVETSLNGVVLSSSINTWSAKQLFNGKRHFAYVAKSQSTSNDQFGNLISETTTKSTYDDFGHLLTSTTTQGEFSKTINNTYDGTAIFPAVVTDVTRYRSVKNPIPASVTNSPTYKWAVIWTTTRYHWRLTSSAKGWLRMFTARDWGFHSEAYIVHTTTVDHAFWGTRKLIGATVTSSSSTDSQTRNSTFAYNAKGQLERKSIEPGDPTLSQTTEYGYDPFGNRTTTTVSGFGISPRTTTVAYDANGMFPTSTTNAIGHAEHYTWDARFAKKKTLTGPNRLTTSWTYDGFGRKIREDRADGTFSAIDLSQSPKTITTTSSGSQPSVVHYDAMGRETSSENTAFDGSIIKSKVEYDHLGHKWKEYLPYKATPSLFTEFRYDSLSRNIKVINPNGDFATVQYNGLSTTATNAKGQSSTTAKNTQGKVVSVTDVMNGMMQYAYDANGNLRFTTDAAGNVTEMRYDIRGRKTYMNDPDMGEWSYKYDVLGNLIRQTDAKLQESTMTYDLLGRMTSRTETEGTSNWSYYDKLTPQVGKWIGALDLVTASNGYQKSYYYDANGRVGFSDATLDNSALGTNNGVPYRVTNSYDAFGRVDTITYPNGMKVKQNYHAQSGALQSVSDALAPGKIYWEATGVDKFGRITEEKFGNGVTSTRTYDQLTGTLTNIASGTVNAPANIQNLGYTYDPIGNLRTRMDVYTEWFDYDALNRIKDVRHTDAGGRSLYNYGYSPIGNILAKSGVGDEYRYGELNPVGGINAGPHAVSSVWDQGIQQRAYQYDANGNMTFAFAYAAGVQSIEREMNWTSFNKPLGIRTQGGYTGFSYDANHNRVMKDTPGNTTAYIGKLFERTVSKNTLNPIVKDVNYIYAGGQLVTIEQDVNGIKETKYVHTDNLGSMHTLTDHLGNIIGESFSFDPFGAPRNRTTLNPLTQASWNAGASRGYTGHEMDASTGLINMNARLYDPVLGRFISADTVVPSPSNMQGFNRYAYVLNNPLLYTDPTGHWSWRNFGKALGQGVVIAAVAAAAFYTGGYAMAAYANAAGVAVSGAATGVTAFSGSAASFTALSTSSLGTAMTGGFVSGAVASSSMTAFYGGNSSQVLNAGLMGGIGGAIGAGVGFGFGGGDLGRMMGATANAGVQSRGDFAAMGRAFTMAGAMVVADRIYTGSVNWARDKEWINGRGKAGDFVSINSGSSNVNKAKGSAITGLKEDGTIANQIGGAVRNGAPGFSQEGGAISKAANHIGGMNSFALLHDIWGQPVTNVIYDIGFNLTTNVPSMLPAAAVTYGALGSHTQLAGSLSVRSD